MAANAKEARTHCTSSSCALFSKHWLCAPKFGLVFSHIIHIPTNSSRKP